MDQLLGDVKAENQKSIRHLTKALEKIRTGRAHPSMLDGVEVEAYGTLSTINQVAAVSTPDAKTITVQPWDKSTLDKIATGIINANLGLNPQNNGELLIISIPSLTEDRRRELVKKAKSEGEQAKVSLRNNRKEANDALRKLKEEGLSEDHVKDVEHSIQRITDADAKKVDELIRKKEADMMTV